MEIDDIYGLSDIKKAQESRKYNREPFKIVQGLKGYFRTNVNQSQSEILAQLKGNTLTITNKIKETRVYSLNFWSTLRLIYQQNQDKIPRYWVGFCIHIDSQYIVSLFHKDNSILSLWKNQLGTKIIIQGFYDDFQPIKKLGMGKTAQVYLAHRKSDYKQFAVKAFSKEELAQNQRTRKGLQNQVHILRSLKNKYILQAYSCYETDKSYYIICEYIKGRTLKDVITKQALTYEQCRKIIQCLAQGLKYLGKNNIAHRDLKPENIVIQRQTNRPVIVDFGLATKCDQTSYIFRRCGTPGYVAPQILRSKKPIITPLADIFSFGIILHLLLLRTLPYKGRSCSQILIQNQKAEFNFNSPTYKEFPSQAKYLLSAMLQVDEHKRITAIGILKFLSERTDEKENYYVKMMISPYPKSSISGGTSVINSIAWSRKQSLQKVQFKTGRIFRRSQKFLVGI